MLIAQILTDRQSSIDVPTVKNCHKTIYKSIYSCYPTAFLQSVLVSDKLAHPLLNLTNNPVPGPADDNTIYVGEWELQA